MTAAPLRVGVIGYRNHAARILDVLGRVPSVSVDRIYHPTKALALSGATNEFAELLDCAAIFIASPNETHAEYLQALAEFRGYVFCEKPPVTRPEDIAKIRIPPERIFFNFNMRFSLMARAISECLEAGHLGRVLFADAFVSHGLAFKPIYAGSWRSDRLTHKLGVIETVGIHHLDLFNTFFGEAVSISGAGGVFSGNGTAFDAGRITLTYPDGCMASVTTSYASPGLSHLRIVGTDGLLEVNAEHIVLRGPRDVFDEQGGFVLPPVLREFDPPAQGLYRDSLERSIRYFVDKARTGAAIDRKLYADSMSTMRSIFALTRQLDARA